MKTILSIAGSDSLSGGGLQADLRTFNEYGINGLNVVTCIVTVDVKKDSINVYEVTNEMLRAQFEACFSQEIEISAIKVGMLADLRTAKVVAEYLKQHSEIPIILDPVLALKEHGAEGKKEIIDFFNQELLPLATITTPNLREAELLSGIEPIDSVEKMKLAAEKIAETGVKNVVVKGGQRLTGELAFDVFYDGHTHLILDEKKITNGFNNGAGCTFASAISSNIALGKSMEVAVSNAKHFVYMAIKNGIPFLDGLGNVFQGSFDS